MRELTLLLKPASGQCNARCAYCFYQDVTQKRNQASCGMMTVETLEIVLRKALRQEEKSCTVIYQGGRAGPARPFLLPKSRGTAKTALSERGFHPQCVSNQWLSPRQPVGGIFCGAPFSGGRFFRWNTQNSRRLPCGCKRQGHVSPGDGYDLPFQKIPGGF